MDIDTSSASQLPAAPMGSDKALKSVEDWQAAIRLGLKYRRQYGRSSEWRRFKNYYRGLFKEGTIPVNIIFAIGRSIIPQVYFRNPRVSIMHKKPGYYMPALVLERLDNLLIQELNIKYQMKSEILDTYLCGRGMGILGYDSEYGFNPELASPEIYGDVSLSSFAKTGERIEYNQNVNPGMPWYLRINPVDFVVPWGTRSFDEAPWFAFRKMRRLRDLKEDPKYTNLDNLKATYVSSLESSDKNDSFQRQEEDQAADWVELWQVHDKRAGRVLGLVLDHPKFLRDDNDELQIDGLPGRCIGFNEDPDYFWWPSDCRMIEHQQIELNEIRTMARAHRRVAVLKALVDKNISSDAITKLLDGDVKAIVPVDVGSEGDIRKSVAFLQSHIPPDLISEARNVREDVREIIGFSRNQSGSFEEPSGRRTATEANIVQAASMIRIDERRDIMADHFESIIRGINQIIFKNWSSERIIDIIGPDGAKYWIRFSNKDLKGEYTYKVNPEEAMPSDQKTKRAESGQFVEMATKIPGLDVKYLMENYAGTFEWLDPRLLFPGQGPGRSPEKALQLADAMRMTPGALGASSYPALGLGI